MRSQVRPARQRSSRRIAAATILVALSVAGCAQHAPEQQSPGASAGYPVTVSAPGGQPVTLRARPQRIVSLSPAETEVLYGVGAGEQVVAVDKNSNYPPQAPKTGIDAFSPDLTAIAKYKPDLVIASDDLGGLVAGLRKVNVPVLLLPAPKDLQQTYAQWRTIGKATGHAAAADRLAGRVSGEIDSIARSVPKPATPLSYYYELDPQFHTATSGTFIGRVLARFGLRNIADSADTAATAGYPQLSAAKVVSASPDLVFLADTVCCGANPASVTSRPGWNTVRAVRDGTVVGLNDDIASRWGPRLVELVRAVGSAVRTAAGTHR